MIRLIVLYDLPEGADEEAFLEWRLGPHQRANASSPGVLRTDFARIDGTWPGSGRPPHRFMTVAEWPDRASFEAAFYDPESEARRLEQVAGLKDPVFLIAEVLVSSDDLDDGSGDGSGEVA
jgi:hypothetical protein